MLFSLCSLYDIREYMKIKELLIHHYKSVEETVHFSAFRHINIFIGPNNAGKTNILDGIELLLNTHVDPLRFDDTDADLLVELETAQTQCIRVTQKNGKKTYQVNGKLAGAQDVGENIAAQMIRISSDATVDDFDFINDLKKFKEEFSKAYQFFIQNLSAYFPRDEINEDLFVSASVRMGVGFQRLFLMLFYIFHPSYSIILIDEPEIHLHPSVLKKLTKLLEDAKLNNQVFLTTHHAIFVQPYNLHHVYRVHRDRGGSTNVYSLDQSHHALDKTRLVQELNADNTQMFFAEQALIVEGVSDRIFMRGMIDRFYSKAKDIKVVYAHGKSNVGIYMDLCSAFHLPCMVLLDKDALCGEPVEQMRRFVRRGMSQSQKLNRLKVQGIYIFPNGGLEDNYPKKYQKYTGTKPLNALYAVNKITKQEFLSPQMRYIREVIEAM